MTSLILVLMSTIPAAEAGPVLRPEAVESLFIEPDRPATIRWRADLVHPGYRVPAGQRYDVRCTCSSDQ